MGCGGAWADIHRYSIGSLVAAITQINSDDEEDASERLSTSFSHTFFGMGM
jgi:hypothetical protein